MAKRTKRTILGIYLVSLIGLAIILLPLSILVYGSFQGGGIQNYVEILTKYHIYTYFMNSLVITVMTVVVVVLLDVLAGFAFSKIDFPLKHFFFVFILSALLLPGASILVPIFQINSRLGLINTYLALLGPYVVTIAPFNLLMMKNGFDEVPNSVLEASLLDGCSAWRSMWSIALPMCRPSLVMAFIWTMLSSWNEYLFAFVMLRKESMMTITVIPNKFQSMYGGRMGMLYSALFIILLPSIIVYFFMQKFIVVGLNAGSVKQ
jgi:ABC-type glycerol-3-phosphate transport system permease component